MTISSGAAPFCTAAQFLRYHDVRTVGDLVGDSGNRVNPTDLLTDTVLFGALRRAAGDIEMACTVGERYQPDDLQALVYGDSDDSSEGATYDASDNRFNSDGEVKRFSIGMYVYIAGFFSVAKIPDGVYVVDGFNESSDYFSLSGVQGSDDVASGGSYYPLRQSNTQVGAEALTGLNADLAFWHLYKRRKPEAKLEDIAGAFQAHETLKALRLSEAVFGLLEQQEAGSQMSTIEAALPGSAADLNRTVVKARRYFGNHGNCW